MGKKMDISFKELSYGNLISHTFPGLFLAFEIILAFRLFTPFNGFNFICSINYTVTNVLGILIGVYVIATLLGIILDAIHHVAFKSKEGYGYEIYKFIKNVDQL
jgi:hypothetical protein